MRQAGRQANRCAARQQPGGDRTAQGWTGTDRTESDASGSAWRSASAATWLIILADSQPGSFSLWLAVASGDRLTFSFRLRSSACSSAIRLSRSS